jgi:hypothetical protein
VLHSALGTAAVAVAAFKQSCKIDCGLIPATMMPRNGLLCCCRCYIGGIVDLQRQQQLRIGRYVNIAICACSLLNLTCKTALPVARSPSTKLSKNHKANFKIELLENLIALIFRATDDRESLDSPGTKTLNLSLLKEKFYCIKHSRRCMDVQSNMATVQTAGKNA